MSKQKQKKPDMTVSMLGQKIPVRFVKPSESSLGEGNLGEYTNIPAGIEIDSSLDLASTKRVLVHEMTHAALALSGIAGYHISESVEESICTVMESAFGDIFLALSKLKSGE